MHVKKGTIIRIQIRHIGVSRDDRQQFVVINNGRHAQAKSTIESPWKLKMGNRSFREELQWYLEEYLSFPTSDYQGRAQAVQDMRSCWGRKCFAALFGEGCAQDWYSIARQCDLTKLKLEIISDDAEVLSWPWEVLESDDGLLALQCQIGRCLKEGVGDPTPFAKDLPREQINILYVIARPYGDEDVGFQNIVRPLVEHNDEYGWPVHIDLLRPPTFEQLRAELEVNPNFYHIVHFDGHGCFSNGAGFLVFEKDNIEHGPDEIHSKVLGELLCEHNIPAMILNSCQSAMHSTDHLASVSAGLLRAGIRDVVAMSYSLWVRGAEAFVPSFYEALFRQGRVAQAICTGRQRMWEHQLRDTFYGEVEFHDWMVPVLYQQGVESALPELKLRKIPASDLPLSAQSLDTYGFIGRDSAILQLERAVRLKPASVLIHGMAGNGKTTLVKGFLQWLEATHGLENSVFWFSFENIHSAEYVINELAKTLVGTEVLSLDLDDKIDRVAQTLRQNQHIIVWDNFESASGIPGTGVFAQLNEVNRVKLKEFLELLNGGRTKVLITSRKSENELGVSECTRLLLGGLSGEELWLYCNAVASNIGLEIDRESEAYRELIFKFDGNPLAIRALLLSLKDKSVDAVLAELEQDSGVFEGNDDARRIQAVLDVFDSGLNPSLAPILRLLGLHEHFVDAGLLGAMLRLTREETTLLSECFSVLEAAGLCCSLEENLYQIHPVLRGCLARRHPPKKVEQQAFVDKLGTLADEYAPEESIEQMAMFSRLNANFHHALRLAQKLGMREDMLALMQAFASHAFSIRNFSDAEQMNEQLLEVAVELGDERGAASVYHSLGMIAQERRGFRMAEDYHEKSLTIELRLKNERGAALTYHHLGMVAQEQYHFEKAENFYKKSLAIEIELGNEWGAANTYHQLGMAAQMRGDYDGAENFYKKSLALKQKLDNEHDVADTYHQLGRVAQERHDYEKAEEYYNQSLAIKKELGNEYGSALTYHQLGRVAEERHDYRNAEELYKESLAISLVLGDEYGAAGTYHQLGIVAQEKCDYKTAENFYKKSLAIELKIGNERGAAYTYYQLGMVGKEQRDYTAAENYYKEALAYDLRMNDEYGAARTYHQLGIIAQGQDDSATAEDFYDKSLSISRRLGYDLGVADTCHNLGVLARVQNNFVLADSFFRESLRACQKLGDERGVSDIYHELGRVAEEKCNLEDARSFYEKALAIYLGLKDEQRSARTYHQLGRVAEEQCDYKTAEYFYEKALVISLRFDDGRAAAGTYHQLGRIAEKQYKRATAENYYKKALTIFDNCQDIDNANIAKNSLANLSKLD